MFDAFFDFMAGALAFFYELSGESYGGAIILLTLAINLALLPLTLKGTRSMMQMQRLQPEMKALQAKYKDDRETLNRELMAFYKENSINPLGGCLPLLLQMPVFLVLYQVVRGLTQREDTPDPVPEGFPDPANFDPKYLDHSTALYQNLSTTNHMDWWGIDLSQSAQRTLSDDGFVAAIPYLILLVLVLVTSFVQQKQVSSRNPDAQTNKQQQMLLRVMPLFFALISWSLPAALTLYFATANMFRVCQQELISRTMYRHTRQAAKEKKASDRLKGQQGKGKGNAIEAKSAEKGKKDQGPVSPDTGSSGLLGRLGITREDPDAPSSGNGSSNGTSEPKAITEKKGTPTPKRGETPKAGAGKTAGSKSKKSTSKGKASAGRATPAGSLPQPRPRKKKKR
jgi:YidC/Oxa1 family membrane protein insertase